MPLHAQGFSHEDPVTGAVQYDTSASGRCLLAGTLTIFLLACSAPGDKKATEHAHTVQDIEQSEQTESLPEGGSVHMHFDPEAGPGGRATGRPAPTLPRSHGASDLRRSSDRDGFRDNDGAPHSGQPLQAGTRQGPKFDATAALYDQQNPAYETLQKPGAAMGGFPTDRRGRIDWVAAMRKGLINPRNAVRETGAIKTLEMPILMTDTREMDYVSFPHRAHTEWLDCGSCHPDPFVPRDNGNDINMDAIFRGEYCGKCHDKVAFSVFVCERCHNTPRIE